MGHVLFRKLFIIYQNAEMSTTQFDSILGCYLLQRSFINFAWRHGFPSTFYDRCPYASAYLALNLLSDALPPSAPRLLLTHPLLEFAYSAYEAAQKPTQSVCGR